MKKLWVFHIITTVGFVFFGLLSLASASSPAREYNPAQTRGQGVIVVRAEYTTYVTVTRKQWVPSTNVALRGGYTAGEPGRIETYTVQQRVRRDRNLPFVVLEDGKEVFRGRTPVRVTNWDPGVWYTIIWTGRNGDRRERSFSIPTTRPFTRHIQID